MASSDHPSSVDDARAFIEDRSRGEEILEATLAVDGTHEWWTFDDLPLDSGEFGELAATDLVESGDTGYKLADPEAIRIALDGGSEHTSAASGLQAQERSKTAVVRVIGKIHTRGLAGLLAVIALAVAIRVAQYPAVFHRDRVVSPANDPYFYRYWQERLVAEADGPLSFGILVEPPWDTGDWNQRPLTHATNWWLTELLGGDQWAAEFLVAWLPILQTILLCVILYSIAKLLTGDIRVGIVAVVVLAVAPVHVIYSTIGVFQHRGHQFLWFGLATLALVWLTVMLRNHAHTSSTQNGVRTHLRSRRTWYVTAIFGLSLGLYMQTWGGSVEAFVVFGGYLGIRVWYDLRAGLRPVYSTTPVVVGLVMAALLSIGLYATVGWHGPLVPAVAGLTILGVGTVFALGAIWPRYDLPVIGLLLIQPVLVLAGVGIVSVLRPDIASVLADSFGRSLFAAGDSVQHGSLYSTEFFVIGRPLIQIGFTFFFALAGLMWAMWRVRGQYEPGWLLLVTLTIFYLVASGILLRFAARLVIVSAVFAALAIVYLFAAVNITRPVFPLDASEERDASSQITASRRKRVGAILGFAIAIFGLSLILAVSFSGGMTHDETLVDAALATGDHANSLEREFPDSYVYAPWGESRLFNYFVSGQSEDETYARFHYHEFIHASDPDAQVDTLHRDEWPFFESGTGYVVLTAQPGSFESESVQSRLYDDLGLATDEFDGLAHYALVYASEDASVVVFEVVPGATLELTGESNETLQLSTTVSVSSDDHVYERTVHLDQGGEDTLTVPYAGTYEINGDQIEVDPETVYTGERMAIQLTEE